MNENDEKKSGQYILTNHINGRFQKHCETGPAVEYGDGSKEWWVNGMRHREDGPAIERATGDKSWYVNGERHREDGPAIEHSNSYSEWYLNGKEYSEEEFHKWLLQQQLRGRLGAKKI